MRYTFKEMRASQGATIVEFALSVALFFVVVFAVIEFGRLLFLYNMAAKATQLATRMATTCGYGPSEQKNIRDKVRFYLEASGQVSINSTTWLDINPSGIACDPDMIQPPGEVETCWITTKIQGLTADLKIPGIPMSVPLPEYRVTQVREAMTDIGQMCK